MGRSLQKWLCFAILAFHPGSFRKFVRKEIQWLRFFAFAAGCSAPEVSKIAQPQFGWVRFFISPRISASSFGKIAQPAVPLALFPHFGSTARLSPYLLFSGPAPAPFAILGFNPSYNLCAICARCSLHGPF